MNTQACPYESVGSLSQEIGGINVTCISRHNTLRWNHTNLQLCKNSNHVWDLKDIIYNTCSNVREGTRIKYKLVLYVPCFVH